jgi:hypothetical protein
MNHDIVLKAIFSIGLLAIAICAGYAKFPLWSIFVIAVPFTIAYIQGKWYLWDELFGQGGRRLYQALLQTYLVQLVVVSIFYLLGSGFARILNQ